MLSKLRTLKSFSGLGHRKITKFLLKDDIVNVGSVYKLSSNGYCTMIEPIEDSVSTTESPELPNWVKFSENKNPNAKDSDDDFAVPELADWIENQKLHDYTKVNDKSNVIKTVLDKDIEKICEVLKVRYTTSEEVADALLSDCVDDVELSDELVKHVLKRFSHDWIHAFGVFEWAKMHKGYKHSPDAYNSMVDILGKAKKFHLMWEVVDEMRSLDGYVTLTTMTKIIRRYCRAGKGSDAIDAFRRMEEFGVKKDLVAMHILIDALAKEMAVEDAEKVFNEFKNTIAPDTNTFNILIHGWCKCRQLDKAQSLLNEMQTYGFKPTVVTYTSLIEAYCRDKDYRKVDETLDAMQEKGCSPNSITYTIVMHSLGKSNQIVQALEVYEKMKNNGCVPDVSFYSSLIYILNHAGRLKDAEDIFNEMEKKHGVSPNVLTYNTMITVFCQHSLEEKALKTLRQMEEASCMPNLETYAPLLKMFGRKKRMKVLLFLLNHMFKNDLSLDVGTYALLVNVLSKSGKLEHACLFFEEMVLKGLTPKDSMYEQLMEKLENKSMGKAMIQIKKLMLKAKARRKL